MSTSFEGVCNIIKNICILVLSLKYAKQLTDKINTLSCIQSKVCLGHLCCCLSALRKKVLDFYQRACLSGYCSAFSYKPMHCALSSQLNGKCIELLQVPGQSAIFTTCDLPGTTPIKQSSRRNSWSSDGMCFVSRKKTNLEQQLKREV